MNPLIRASSSRSTRVIRKTGETFRRTMQLFHSGTISLLILAALNMGGVSSLLLGTTNARIVDSEIDNSMSRRSCLTKAMGGLSVFCAAATAGFVKPVLAKEYPETSSESLESNRKTLMQLIQQPSSTSNEAAVLAAIENLLPFDPSHKKGAALAGDLDGEWELLWSAKAEAFSPLLKLPRPFKPDSFQYLGSAAAMEVGPDRVAQGLTGGILGTNQLWLSSGVRTSDSDDSVLEILPPFRFEVGGRYQSGLAKKRLVEAGSDADFRKLNARTSEAQAAPKNSYRQLYLEREGKGSLRISTITDGDPVIVGAIFVHRKL